ncbi:hypothetical protein ACS0TY_019137 [Phlomoides rotata]
MDDENILEALQPYPNLAILRIQRFRGRELALCMKNMNNLNEIYVSDCHNFRCLPPFRDLPLLKFLHIARLDILVYIVEKDDIGCQNSLGPLILPSLGNLSSIYLGFDEIATCSNNVLEDALQGLCNLVSICNAKEHRHLPKKWCRDLNFVTVLRLSRCNMGSCFPKGWMWNLTSLEVLDIWHCWGLVELADEFKHLHFLKHLQLGNVVDMIESLPSSIQGMTNLMSFEMSKCPQLKRRCQKPNGEDWPKIARIPQLYI